MDTIFLRDLRVRTIVGVWEWERRSPQQLSIDVDIATDTRPAAASERLEDALDYNAVARRIQGFVSEARFRMIEAMAEGIAGIVLQEFGAPWVRVVVRKLWPVPGMRDTGVAIERGSRPVNLP